MPSPQGRYWLLTIPANSWNPTLPSGCCYIKGQKELSQETAYEHWQVLAITPKKLTLVAFKRIFDCELHAELSRSIAAEAYVWKESTRVPDTQFEFGTKPLCRSSAKDWQLIWDAARNGDYSSIPAQVLVCHYRSLRSITTDYLRPVGLVRTCYVFWGKTGTGKSRRAWEEAGCDAYSKDPRSKFWCGYQRQEQVVIDEFRGGIDISHLLRWLDRYPVHVETKGGAVALSAHKFWITSNIHPTCWYPTLDAESYLALERRLEITEFE